MSTANDKQSKTVGQMSTCWSSHEGLEKMLRCYDGSVLTRAKIFPVTFSGNECWTLKKQEEKRLWTLERTPKEIVASQEKQTHDGTNQARVLPRGTEDQAQTILLRTQAALWRRPANAGDGERGDRQQGGATRPQWPRGGGLKGEIKDRESCGATRS